MKESKGIILWIVALVVNSFGYSWWTNMPNHLWYKDGFELLTLLLAIISMFMLIATIAIKLEK